MYLGYVSLMVTNTHLVFGVNLFLQYRWYHLVESILSMFLAVEWPTVPLHRRRKIDHEILKPTTISVLIRNGQVTKPWENFETYF